VLLKEIITGTELADCMLMLAAVIISQLPVSKAADTLK
jgi:hypothetical protein